MILIWIDDIKEEKIRAFLSLIENWKDFKAIIEYRNSYYLISTRKIHEKMKELEEENMHKLSKSMVLKSLKEVYRKPIYYIKTRFRKKENILKKYKNEHIILFLEHE